MGPGLIFLRASMWLWFAAESLWPPQPLPSIELRGSEECGAFVEDAAGWSPHLITLFLAEKNPEGTWMSARQHVEWAHKASHSYVADGTGCLVIIAHPTPRQFDTITSLDLDGMEVNHSGNAEPFEELWDRVLTWRIQQGIRPIWGSGADDTHSITDIDKSWIALRLESLTEANVKAALRRGSFYASNGPVIRDIQVDGATIRVSPAQKADVRWVRSGQFGTGPPEVSRDPGRNRCLRFDAGTERSSYTLSPADGTSDPKALFVRAIVTTSEPGKAAQTQPFLIRQGGRLENPYAARGEWHKGMTHNHTDLFEGRDELLARYFSAYAARGHSAAFETQYDYWVTPMARYPGGRTPQIAEITPRMFEGGDVRIAGRYFQEGCTVLVDGSAAPQASRVSDAEIRLRPQSPGRGWHEVTVRNPNGLQDTRMLGFGVRDAATRVGKWTWYTPSNSALGSRYVYAAAADPRGGVWFGTNRGINYFDGEHWKLIREEPGASLDDVIYDLDPSEGTLWFTCFRGVGALHRDGARERWTWKEAGFGGHQINQVLRTDGATYISTHNRQGFFVFRDGKWSRIALPEYARGLVNSIVKGPDGRLWLGTGSGVLSWDARGGSEAWKRYDGLPEAYVRRIAFDRLGRLWAGTATHGESDAGGLCMLAGGRWTVYSPANSPLPERRVWSVFVDSSGGVWAATSKGAARLDPDGRWSVYNVMNSGLGDNVVADIAEDSSGDMWFATSYGVSRLARR